MNTGKVDVLLGLQWGDEGKGKVVDVLTPRYDVVARFQWTSFEGASPYLKESSSYYAYASYS